LISFILLLYSRYDDHRDLHSFPTRRSSDLPRIDDFRRPLLVAAATNSSIPIRNRRTVFSSFRVNSSGFGNASLASNAHCIVRRRDRKSTRLNSRSRGHLVCRLLLEKKNKKI